jgi:hypothetical protein
MGKEKTIPKAPAIPEQEADIKERIEGFNKEIGPILAKYELGIGAVAKLLPDGRVAADPILVSMRKAMQEVAKGKAEENPKSNGLDNPDA